jgi:hypothetical protein
VRLQKKALYRHFFVRLENGFVWKVPFDTNTLQCRDPTLISRFFIGHARGVAVERHNKTQ